MRPLLFLPLLLVACGGPNNAAIFDDPGESDASSTGDGSTTTDTGTSPGTDSGGGGNKDTGTTPGDTAPPPETITLDNVCAKLADAYCTSTLESCCGTRSLAWDEAGCRDAITTECGYRVDDTKAGNATFDPSAFAGCKAAWSSLTTKCSVPALEFIKVDAICGHLFMGDVPPGDSCAEDWECKVGPGAFGNCNSSGRCESIRVVGKDQPCAYSGSTRALCDYGLACSFSSGGGGTCKDAKPVGSTCNSSYECGFGFYCQRSGGSSTGKCAAGLPAGATCYSNESCASASCSGGRCSDPNYTPASSFVCDGSG